MGDRMIEEQTRNIPVLDEVDVVVAGGGTAGVAAAVSAARAGARTMLIERQGMLGGVATAALMTSTCNWGFTGDNRQVSHGVVDEIYHRVAEAGGTTPDWRTRRLPCIPFDQEVFRTVLVEMVMDSGVETLLETWVAGVIKEGEKLKGVLIESKSGRQAVLADAFVDTSGDADLAAFAGAPLKTKLPNSGSLLFQMRNVDLDKTVKYFEENPDEWQQYSDRMTPLENFLANWYEYGCFHLPHGGGRKMRLVQDAIKRGEYTRQEGLAGDLDVFGMFAYRGSGAVMINSCNFKIDHLDIKTLSLAEMQARRQFPKVAAFLKKHMPGFDKAVISDSASMIGSRCTRWVDSDFELTKKDADVGTPFEDVIGVRTAHSEHLKGGVIHHPRVTEMPYRIMLPRGLDNLIVSSGKSAATNPGGLLRGQVSCMVLGQAGGVAAALCSRSGKAFPELDIKELQVALLNQDVYLGSPERLKELGLV